MSDARTAALKTAFRLNVVLTLWNVAEGILSVILAVMAGSVALLGFGVDSGIEVTSSVVLLRRLSQELNARDPRTTHRAEERAQKIAGILLLLLATYLLVDSLRRLAGYGGESEKSVAGIVLTALSMVVMPVMGVWKLRLARQLSSGALRADAFETITCAWLSLATLVGLSLRAAFDWTWADPAAALLLIPLLVREGWEAIQTEDDACETDNKSELS